eukprot:scaffold8464_cov57-Phaeocystis_antarctica.AAC.3
MSPARLPLMSTNTIETPDATASSSRRAGSLTTSIRSNRTLEWLAHSVAARLRASSETSTAMTLSAREASSAVAPP